MGGHITLSTYQRVNSHKFALIDALLFASERMQDGVGLGKDKYVTP